jgi:hypothetical protein
VVLEGPEGRQGGAVRGTTSTSTRAESQDRYHPVPFCPPWKTQSSSEYPRSHVYPLRCSSTETLHFTAKVVSLCGRAICRFGPRPRSRPLTRTRSRTCFHAPDSSPPAHRPCDRRSDPRERLRSRPRTRRPSASRARLGACAAESAAKKKQSAWRPASIARRFGDSQQSYRDASAREKARATRRTLCRGPLRLRRLQRLSLAVRMGACIKSLAMCPGGHRWCQS